MTTRHFYILSCAVLGLLIAPATAYATSQITVPWQCSFEAEEDLSDWVFNQNSATATDQWVIGDATRSDGHQSLYISPDGGENAMSGAKQNVVMAYRKVHFPEHASGTKNYDISFDWKAMGPQTQGGTLYVFFGYYSQLITGSDNLLQYASSSSAATLPTRILGQASFVYSSDYSRRQAMSQEQRWRNVSMDAGPGTTYSVGMTSNNAKKDYALVFVWVNKNISKDSIGLGACIDNIQIASAQYEKPKNLQAVMQCEDSSFVVSWTGNVNDYSVEYRRSNQASWRRFTHQATPPNFQYKIKSLKEGTYDFRVRGWRGNDTTAYTVLNGKSLLCMENHCINYVDLDHAKCTYGQYASSSIDPYQYDGRIDYGKDEISSFHTVCSDVSEYDLRTGNKLKTVPDNEIASVRLGTWLCPSSNKFVTDDGSSVNIGGYSVTYDLTVDTATQALLLLKYAIVMEQAHDDNTRAFFRLEILDEDGSVLDADCGAKEFYCPKDSTEAIEAGWTIYSRYEFPYKNKEHGLNSSNIYWKDWTTMGINLLEQSGVRQGDHLKVRIIARGCTAGGHYCYGYFTLNCASASIETDQCSGNPKVVAEAPEGFSYTWFAEKNRDLYDHGIAIDADGEKVVRSREAELNVNAGDTNIYVCRLCDLIEPSCYFELKTKLSPRAPMPLFRHRQRPTNCANTIYFTDSARVADYGADGRIHISAEPCEGSDFTVKSLVTGKSISNSSQSFTFDANPSGDTLRITQTSYIADGTCTTTKDTTIIIPNILTPDSLIMATVCRNNGYTFYGDKLIKTGVYRHEMKNRYGCDSVEVLDLTVNPVSVITIADTISSLQLPYSLTGVYKGTPTTYKRGVEEAYATTQNYTVVFTNHYDCDSTINLQLTVIPQLSASAIMEDMESKPYYCADQKAMTVSYILQHGDFDSLRVSFDPKGHQQNLQDIVIYHNPYTSAPVVRTEELTFPFESTIHPDVYPVKVEFFQHHSCGETIVENLMFDVRYSSSILQQMWGEAIFIRNTENNGGYTFTSYQWYENGQPIEGATQPYLYYPLNTNNEYCVLLTRQSDNVRQFSCPIIPVVYNGVDDVKTTVDNIPTMLHVGQELTLDIPDKAVVSLYTPTGTLCATQTCVGGMMTIYMPYVPGCYILQVKDATATLSKTIMVIP